ncbi:MAG: hypothetical protein HKN46_01500 [Acidimicrobiia bacterium]|nr:hypothetical protein [Acidimicrobiia bacterium]
MTVRRAFLQAVQVVPDVVDALAPHWDEESSLEGWSVGGLTGHFARGVGQVARYLDEPTPPRGPELDAEGYFEFFGSRAAELGASIVARGEAEGAEGPNALRSRVGGWSEALVARLPGMPVDHRVAVLEARSLSLDEYLRTRLVELVVHHADLSSTTTLPELPAEARDAAIVVLTELARRRHGDRALIEALSRSERAEDISAF